MAEQVFPTKGNLINTKKSLALAKVGFELLDRKRNIIVREMMTLIDRASAIQSRIDSTYAQAYLALQRANVAHGICDDIADAVPVENGLSLSSRSVMGVEIPIVTIYAMYLPIFVMWMKKAKDESIGRRFIIPILAFCGAAFMVFACIIGHKFANVYYLIVFAVIMVIGGIFRKNKKGAAV